MEEQVSSKVDLRMQQVHCKVSDLSNISLNHRKISSSINGLQQTFESQDDAQQSDLGIQILDQTKKNKRCPMDDYFHYLEQYTPHKRASYRELTSIDKQQYKYFGLFPYTSILNCIGENNTYFKGDIQAHDVIQYIENYSFEQIGLCFDVNKKQTTKNKMNEKFNKIILQSQSLFFSSFPSYSQISSDFENIIKQKFTLYIQSKYKALKSSNLVQLQQCLDQQIFNALFKQIPNFSQLGHQDSEQSKQSQNLSLNGTNESMGSQKSYNFNMSKYFMVFILQLLVKDHLNRLFVDSAVKHAITKITDEILQISKRNEDSKTNFYNHSHFNLLFLKINQKNSQTVQKNQQLFLMHKTVFKVESLDNSYVQITINVLKEHMTRIVLAQLNILENHLIIFNSDSMDLTDDLKKDIESKIDYFFRVKRAILQLQKGKMINRF